MKYIDFMNNSKTRLIGMASVYAMTLKEVVSKPSKKAKRAIGRYEEIRLKKGIAVRYLLKPGELEGDHRHRATDPYWSLRMYKIKRVVVRRNQPQPVLYYLEDEPIESTAHMIERTPKGPLNMRNFKKLKSLIKLSIRQMNLCKNTTLLDSSIMFMLLVSQFKLRIMP